MPPAYNKAQVVRQSANTQKPMAMVAVVVHSITTREETEEDNPEMQPRFAQATNFSTTGTWINVNGKFWGKLL